MDLVEWRRGMAGSTAFTLDTYVKHAYSQRKGEARQKPLFYGALHYLTDYFQGVVSTQFALSRYVDTRTFRMVLCIYSDNA
ncbi:MULTISPECIES: hypothetical protein [Massilia]|uniref:Uncharacterized protein n=1 Tax=Massilia haematophila TaxID=457923 RepID=A0ABV7PSY6_9BURK|nr:hypothetical protein [Massilia sp.]